ncbi:MAG: hypothetical protein MJ247_06000 [Alphaproteobacteria bacterium]|nr:hypothetical protein [Alphaproteobacteria bacterium]
MKIDAKESKNKVKELLLLSDEDVPLLLTGNFKGLYKQNKDGCVRVTICYASILLLLCMFLIIFSFASVFFKLILSLLIFGILGGVCFVSGEENVKQATKYPAFSYFTLLVFGLMTLFLAESISSSGSLLATFCLLLIVGGVGSLMFFLRGKAVERGYTKTQVAIVSMFLISFLLSFQSAFVQFGGEVEVKNIRRQAEYQRLRDAERMKEMSASSKPCTNSAECSKVNTNKSKYFEQYEDIAQNFCEQALSQVIQERFEWTVSPKEYKFNSHEIDVLKDLIILRGDSAQLIGQNGIRVGIKYVCKYDVEKKTAEANYSK